MFVTSFHVIWNPFENPHGIPTDPWEFIIVPIPIPHPYPWESPWEFPYPRQPCLLYIDNYDIAFITETYLTVY